MLIFLLQVCFESDCHSWLCRKHNWIPGPCGNFLKTYQVSHVWAGARAQFAYQYFSQTIVLYFANGTNQVAFSCWFMNLFYLYSRVHFWELRVSLLWQIRHWPHIFSLNGFIIDAPSCLIHCILFTCLFY